MHNSNCAKMCSTRLFLKWRAQLKGNLEIYKESFRKIYEFKEKYDKIRSWLRYNKIIRLVFTDWE